MEAPRDPEEAEASGSPVMAEIDGATTLGAVHLTVTDLVRSVEYYRQVIGLTLLDQTAVDATLGVAGHELLVIVEEPEARQAPGHTGLYHFALLLPQRKHLAAWLAHAASDRVPLTGLSDHFVSEALYLRDPDGHGIEIYWDRPREHWEHQVASRMTTLPLDVDDLLAELDGSDVPSYPGMPEGTIMGHVHLQVSSIATTVPFYRDVLGFGLMAELGSQAAFLSAGGYHHHIGANIWESAGGSPPPPGSVRLRHATIVLPDEAALGLVVDRVIRSGQEPRGTAAGPMVEDPSGNLLLLTMR